MRRLVPFMSPRSTTSDANMSKGTGATPAMTWKSGVLAVILLLGIIGPLLIVSWMWGGPGFCPAVPMMSQMENINDKMNGMTHTWFDIWSLKYQTIEIFNE